MHNAKATDEEIAKHVGGVMRAGKSRERLNAALRDSLRDADGILARGGIDDPVLRTELTQPPRLGHRGRLPDLDRPDDRATPDR